MKHFQTKLFKLLILTTLILALSGCKTAGNEAENSKEAVTLTGYLTDVHCLFKEPGTDSQACLNMKSCAASGFGINYKKSDNTYEFYFLDGDFATNDKTFSPGTAGQLKAWNLIQNDEKKESVPITVKGFLTNEEKTYTKDGTTKKYKVFSIKSIT